jgi:hypothetical protein
MKAIASDVITPRACAEGVFTADVVVFGFGTFAVVAFFVAFLVVFFVVFAVAIAAP